MYKIVFLYSSSIETSLADDDLSFDTSYASVSFTEYTLNRACLLEADAMALELNLFVKKVTCI